MYTSLTLTSDSIEELRPRSSLPWVWFGFFFVAAFVIEETLAIVLDLDQGLATLVLILIAIAGWIFWFFCIYRFHKILGEISRNQYPITGGEAVGKHFIPFYNLVWIFRWPAAMSEYLNQRERIKMMSGNLLGFFLLISSLVARFFDGGVGLTGVFVVGMYISMKLRQHVELIGGVSRDLLPPNPDPSLFWSTATMDQRNESQRTSPAQSQAETTSVPSPTFENKTNLVNE
jgi:hypothetical protein